MPCTPVIYVRHFAILLRNLLENNLCDLGKVSGAVGVLGQHDSAARHNRVDDRHFGG
jgi:hypothetical protein